MLDAAEKFQIMFEKLDDEGLEYMEFFDFFNSSCFVNWEKSRALMIFLKCFMKQPKCFHLRKKCPCVQPFIIYLKFFVSFKKLL